MLINIFSSPHSGSTILARWLSQMEDTVAVGEVFQHFKNRYNPNETTYWCSCGKRMESCPIWGKGFKNRKEVIEGVAADVVIDSSKKYCDGDLQVFIYKNPWQLWKSALRDERPTFGTFWNFLRQTVKKWAVVKRHPHLIVSYSKFRKAPYDVLFRVAERVGKEVDYVEKSHIARSNKSKFLPLKIV